ncbi:hypothetical protein NBRC10512_004439 [Rhodotorula toruloides]|uniref:histidine kinase n=2 Tax=Rhodotorula toruloides TaxID=5286 RepID=A0A061BLB4_RHOTO|nr:RTA-like protein, two-component response regulator [Rhodotorula toruloides NP11]EMS25454.1 RTA-like protein, two-component response regulator [Rhodotorula toruloides NP11]CDR47856.1 RHTO0S15e02784g1_1 [Rhodotorula toruloides]
MPPPPPSSSSSTDNKRRRLSTQLSPTGLRGPSPRPHSPLSASYGSNGRGMGEDGADGLGAAEGGTLGLGIDSRLPAPSTSSTTRRASLSVANPFVAPAAEPTSSLLLPPPSPTSALHPPHSHSHHHHPHHHHPHPHGTTRTAGGAGAGDAPRPSKRPRLASQTSNETTSSGTGAASVNWTVTPPVGSGSRASGSSAGSERVDSGSVSPGDEIRLEGYRDVQVLSTHYDDVVACRAISTARGDQRVALKFSLSGRPSVAAQFKAEAALLGKLRAAGISNITKVLARENGRYGSMLVVANDEFRMWSETYHLRNRPPAPYWTDPTALVRAIDNAIQLVRLMASIHKVGIVHASIRPTTVSNSNFGQVYLHDFSCSFASTLSASASEIETTPIRERGMKEESLPYLAPECSGRVGKTAGYQSDYYSVGATLYEVFTGQVPFVDATDPLEIVHAHIARRPPLMTAVDSSVPHALSLIVAKLLEKSPDARYQTSQGLIVDLERVKELVVAYSSPDPTHANLSSATGSSENGRSGSGSGAGGREASPVSASTTDLGHLGADFVPGSLDEAAYFRLPPASMLFGRDESIRALRDAFERVKTSTQPAVVVVKGNSGIGKTSLIETLRAPAAETRGHFTSVKFDQIKSPVPFFAITQSLSGLFRQLLSEPEAQLAVWRRRLTRALGKEARVIADVLPTLEQLFEPGWLEKQPQVPVLNPQESEERFRGVVQKVLRAFARAGKPLVVVFDDLQWSTLSDLVFIRSLAMLGTDEGEDPLSSKTACLMLLLCVFRDNEVGPDHIVETDLLAKLPSPPLTVSLEPLNVANISSFISQALRNPSESSGSAHSPSRTDRVDASIQRLSELILERTNGSPLFVAQLLKAFNAEGLFSFNFSRGVWEYDLDLIASKSVSTNVVELLQAQMGKYPAQTQAALKVAACLGNEDLNAVTLAKAAGRTLEEISRDLQDAVQEGLMVPFGEVPVDPEQVATLEAQGIVPGSPNLRRRQSVTEGGTGINMAVELLRPKLQRRKQSVLQKPPVPETYRFFHDRCQQAAYALIPKTARSGLHYTIGQRLVAAFTEEEINDSVFDLVQQLDYGMDILATTEERDKLAFYNYLAGRKANSSTAFEAARNYLQIAWDLLGVGGWVGQYDLMSKVVELLVNVEYSLTDYGAAQEYVRVFLQHSRDTVAKLRVYAVAIRCASATGDSAKAIDVGREGLAMAGHVFPETAEAAEALIVEVREKLALDVETVKEQRFTEVPLLVDPIAAGCQAILAALVPPVYFVRIDLLGALSSLSLRIAVENGYNDAGAFCLTLHAILVRSKFGQERESLAYGKAAISFFEKHGGSPLACPTYKVFSSHVAVWSTPFEDVFATFRQAVSYGIEYRDAEYLGFGCGELCSYSLLAGVSLSEIGSNIERYAVLVRKFRHELSTTYIGVVQQAVLCLLGRAADPLELDGEAFSLDDYHVCQERRYSLTILLFHMLRLMIAIFFGDSTRANESIAIGRNHLSGGQGLIYPAFFQLFEAVALYEQYDALSSEQRDHVREAHVLLDDLAKGQPDNFLPLKLMLDAEQKRVSGPAVEALQLYDEAIAAATAQRMVHLAACMNERAASYLGNVKLRAGYLIEAHALWAAWGCAPKVSKMEADYPLVFPARPVLPSAHQPIPANTPPLSTDLAQAGELGDASTKGSSSTDSTEQAIGSASSRAAEEIHSLHSWMNEAKVQRRPSTGSHDSHSHSHSEHHDADMVSHSRSIDHSDIYARSQLATELDLRTIVTASSVISGELSVDGVVSKLLNLTLRTAGAEMCLLVLDKNGTLCAEAIARSESSEVQHLRRTDAIDSQPERYPCAVLNYVARSKEMVVNTLDALGESVQDPYLQARKPKSILCLALASQQRIIGVLYLENSQTTTAFTPDRLEILSLISGQAASTIEKARLVQDLKKTNQDLQRSQAALEASNRNLETKIADRTLELRHNNALLQAEVAEKERAQAEMRHAKEIAESATAMKSQFLANMSHEIRTPFNAVVALSSLLLETQLTPVQTDYVETIKNSSQELLVVINDILDYSKIELDHLELTYEPVHLRAVIESSMDMVAERAATKSVELALLIEEGDIYIMGDLARLRQIIVNLLSNAVKFCSDGEITVTASSRPADPDEKGQQRRLCSISVKDTGIGIAKENFGRLFRVFSQAEGAETSRNFGGTGLGLAISRKLARLMDGDLTVESELGVGSTFTVVWLAPASSAPEKDPYARNANRDLIGKRALIVDANATSRMVLSQLLTSFGLLPEAPAEHNNAFSMANDAAQKKRPYDLVIVDAFLPSFAAQTLLRRLRQKGLDSPAIALTRMGSPIYEEMRQLDCKFLIKPIKRNRLHHTLRLVFPAGESSRVSSPAPGSPAFPTNLATRNPLAILVAEDNPINVKVISHLLKRMGYSCDVAEDGLAAVEKAQRKRYDLILMDLNMPRMDGLTATRRIIELMPDPVQRPSIVCLTANAMAEDRQKCLDAGADGYVSKPILVPELVSALNSSSAKRAASYGPSPVPPPPSSGSGLPFELELPTSRLGRGSRKNSSGSNRSTSSKGTRSGPPSPSPEPASNHGNGVPKVSSPGGTVSHASAAVMAPSGLHKIAKELEAERARSSPASSDPKSPEPGSASAAQASPPPRDSMDQSEA